MDFKAPRELRNPVSKAVLGKFQGACGHSKYNCLQDRANFHKSGAWQVVLIFNTVYMLYLNCTEEFQSQVVKISDSGAKFLHSFSYGICKPKKSLRTDTNLPLYACNNLLYQLDTKHSRYNNYYNPMFIIWPLHQYCIWKPHYENNWIIPLSKLHNSAVKNGD